VRRKLWSLLVVVGLLATVPVGSPASAQTQPPPGSGYVMLGYDGTVYSFGSAPHCGHADSVFPPLSFGADIELFPNGNGYWVLDGRSYVDIIYCDFADIVDNGYEINNFFSGQLRADERPLSLSATPDGTGYWVFTNQGRALPFGSAQWYGDMGNVTLNGPVLDSVATPSGQGYWMVASDGGIFAFGDAQFYGSMGGQPLNQPVMSMAPDPDGRGYWLVASDGGIFAFDAPFYGSMGSTRLNRPIAGMVASPTGGGYLMVGADGGIFSFGDVPFHGSLGATPPFFPISAVAVMP
jgi:ribosomal protein L24E